MPRTEALSGAPPLTLLKKFTYGVWSARDSSAVFGGRARWLERVRRSISN
jgi:hypothetical protein